MSGKNLENRLKALEDGTPGAITLTLDDGTKIEHPGPALKFYMEALNEIRRSPKARARYLRVVSATGCGRMHELLVAFAHGPVKNNEGGNDGDSHPRRNPTGNPRPPRRVRRRKARADAAVAVAGTAH